ncbi:DNRLRE domain-containing protein [Granulosicoccaceae sp. 1_MG-2023]|nr:DNRLRE domain-containing protein [Granulosicoccaceae sp. 1_MG-2023]
MKRSRGFVLVSVMLILVFVAGLGLWLSQSSMFALRLAGNEQRMREARAVAQAGMEHLLWQLEESGSCDNYTGLENVSFDGHSYSASVSPDNGSPVRASVQATLDDGQTIYTLLRESQPVYQAPQSLELPVGDDTYIDGSAANSGKNYGSTKYYQVGWDDSAEQAALLQIETDDLPDGARIESAVLTFQTTSLSLDSLFSGNTVSLTVHRIRESWSEGDVTYEEGDDSWDWPLVYDPDPAGSIDVKVSIIAKEQELDVTRLVQDWVNGTYPNYGLTIRAAEGEGNVSIGSDESTLLNAPALSVVYRCECGHDC